MMLQGARERVEIYLSKIKNLFPLHNHSVFR